jgi:hypothetical protein
MRLPRMASGNRPEASITAAMMVSAQLQLKYSAGLYHSSGERTAAPC